ncbi:MAG: DUF1285 domain-containing protein [Parvularculaceae bacterium]
MRYAADLEGVAGRRLPPVDQWNPEYCGELDLTIRADGTWTYQGTPIRRARLVRLFSTVLRREGERYFLVTPVEKLKITVEDAPFTAVLMREEGAGEDSKLVFTTNVGDEVTAGRDHALSWRNRLGGGAPYIHVRAGLDALLSRSVMFDLVSLGETRLIGETEKFGVTSGGVYFPLANVSEIFSDASI